MTDNDEFEKLFAFHPDEDQPLTDLRITTGEIVERALASDHPSSRGGARRRVALAIAAAVLLAVPLGWRFLDSRQTPSVQGVAISIQCFRGPTPASGSDLRELNGSLESTCHAGSPGDHGQARRGYACVRLTGQVAIFTARPGSDATPCAKLGLPPFMGDIRHPDATGLMNAVRGLTAATPCLQPASTRYLLASALGRTGSAGWQIKSASRSSCVTIVVELHSRTLLLVGRS